jgi:Fe-S oxidoreductase
MCRPGTWRPRRAPLAGLADTDALGPYVERGAKVVAINPTCSMMMRREWPTLLEGSDRSRAERLAKLVVDPSELLVVDPRRAAVATA